MKGKLFIVSAPSGAGKSTLVAEVLGRLRSLYSIERVVTYTTKKPRAGEVPGQDYHYISDTEFQEKLKAQFFMEYSTSYGTYYGSPCEVIDQLAIGHSFVLIIDRAGAEQVIRFYKEVILIWITVPTLGVLKERLESRNTENEDSLRKRLTLAQKELNDEEKVQMYQYHVMNDSFDRAAARLESIIASHLGRKKVLK